MLRKIRVSFAVLFFVLITLLFLDFTGTVHTWFGWMAKIQFLPALLALNLGVVVLLVLLTFIFRTHLLFGSLSARCVSGYYIMDGWKAEEEPFSLF